MKDPWPAWATQPVEIAEPNPRWPNHAATLAREVDRRLAPWLDGITEHVGSTAVRDLPAKPVLDLMAPIRSLGLADRVADTLSDVGWRYVPPHLDQRPWRRLYVLPDGDRRRTHLALIERSHPRWRKTLAFREQLRRRPDLAGAYARIKMEAARTHHDDREGYTDAKTAFIEQVIDQSTERSE